MEQQQGGGGGGGGGGGWGAWGNWVKPSAYGINLWGTSTTSASEPPGDIRQQRSPVFDLDSPRGDSSDAKDAGRASGSIPPTSTSAAGVPNPLDPSSYACTVVDHGMRVTQVYF